MQNWNHLRDPWGVRPIYINRHKSKIIHQLTPCQEHEKHQVPKGNPTHVLSHHSNELPPHMSPGRLLTQPWADAGRGYHIRSHWTQRQLLPSPPSMWSYPEAQLTTVHHPKLQVGQGSAEPARDVYGSLCEEPAKGRVWEFVWGACQETWEGSEFEGWESLGL